MTYDHALTNQNSSWIRNVTCLSAISQALLMDCCAGPTKGEKLKRMTLTSTQHTGALISFYKDWLWDAFKLLIAFSPLERRPPFPPSPHNTPGNLCLNPPPPPSLPSSPTPILSTTHDPHSPNRSNKGNSLWWPIYIINSVNETKLSLLDWTTVNSCRWVITWATIVVYKFPGCLLRLLGASFF